MRGGKGVVLSGFKLCLDFRFWKIIKVGFGVLEYERIWLVFIIKCKIGFRNVGVIYE